MTLVDGLKLENGILKEVGSNESDFFACLLAHLSRRLMGELMLISSHEPFMGKLIVYQSLRRPGVRQHFQKSSPLKPLGQLDLNFI